MPRICTVCAHPERRAIDAAVVAGAANRAIARQYRVSKDAVARHADGHVAATYRAAHPEEFAPPVWKYQGERGTPASPSVGASATEVAPHAATAAR